MSFSLKKDHATYPVGYSDLIPEGIVGVIPNYDPTSEIPVPYETPKNQNARPTKDKVGDPIPESPVHAGVPPLSIDYERLTIPDLPEGIELDNVIDVEEELLNYISDTTTKRTKNLTELILKNTAPSLVAYATSMNYVEAVMSDSFGIELEEDPSLPEALKEITKIEILEFFVRRLRISDGNKDQIMSTLIEKMLTSAVVRMDRVLAQKHTESKIKTMEAVLSSRSKSGVMAHRTVTPQATEERLYQPSTTL